MSEPRILKRGMSGPDVTEWQKVLGVMADGIFGELTETMTKMWQRSKGLVPDGIVGPITRAAAALSSTLPPPQPPIDSKPAAFIQARYFDKHRFGTPISLIVVHTAETGEGPKSARSVGNWFASEMIGKDGLPHGASTHYGVDANEIIQYLPVEAMAWGAGKVNRRAIHIEHAGRASQTSEQWADSYSETMLRRSAMLCAELCRRFAIPIKRIGPDEVKANAAGFCGHVDVTKAYDVKGGHVDPGPHFPWAHFMKLIMDADGMGDVKPDATA